MTPNLPVAARKSTLSLALALEEDPEWSSSPPSDPGSSTGLPSDATDLEITAAPVVDILRVFIDVVPQSSTDTAPQAPSSTTALDAYKQCANKLAEQWSELERQTTRSHQRALQATLEGCAPDVICLARGGSASSAGLDESGRLIWAGSREATARRVSAASWSATRPALKEVTFTLPEWVQGRNGELKATTRAYDVSFRMRAPPPTAPDGSAPVAVDRRVTARLALNFEPAALKVPANDASTASTAGDNGSAANKSAAADSLCALVSLSARKTVSFATDGKLEQVHSPDPSDVSAGPVQPRSSTDRLSRVLHLDRHRST